MKRPWKPTHRIHVKNHDRPVEVMYDVGGAAYTREEWDAIAPSDFEYDRSTDSWTFQGQPFSGTVHRILRRKKA